LIRHYAAPSACRLLSCNGVVIGLANGTKDGVQCFRSPFEDIDAEFGQAKEFRMSKLKTIAAAGVTAIVMAGAVAAPTMAQPYGNYERGYNNAGRGYQNYDRNLTSSYVDSLEWRINNAAQEGRLSWPEARQLRAQLRQIQGPAIYRVETGRASQGEYRRVSNVVRRIEAATQGYARNERNERYGYNRY
jgi:hypothetical protein